MSLNIDQITSENFQTLLLNDLQYSPENINEAFVDQPAKFAYWATLAAQSKEQVQKKSLEVEHQEEYIKKTLTGLLDSKYRKELERNKERVTEARISSLIVSDSEYVAELDELHRLQNQLIQLQTKQSLLLVAKEAFVQRKDMIISLGANLRQELNND